MFIKKSNLLILFFVILILLLSGFSAFGLENIKIAMGYIPNVQFAPYYVAEELGYFQSQGLKVKFDYGMSTDIMSLVSQGMVDFGVSDGDQVIVARSKGLKIKAVYSMYVKYPISIVTLKENGINSIQDLKRRRIGIPGPYGSSYIGLQILLHSAGLVLKDIDLISIGYTQVESLLSNKVDATVVYVNNEAVVLKSMGKELSIFKVYDISPMVSAVIVTSDRKIRENPDTVKKFVKAVKFASEYIYKNNGGVMNILKKYIPTLSERNIKMNQNVLNESMKLWIDEDVKKHGFGYTSFKDWEESIEILKEINLLKDNVNAYDCYTDRFLQ